MTRTTLDLDASILRELKERQQDNGKTLGVLVSELLAQALAAEQPEPPPFTWHSRPMGKPRVDLEDKEALWAILDQEMLDGR